MKNVNKKLECPTCGSIDLEKIHDRVWSAEDKKVYRCMYCQVGFLNPMMTQAEEKIFYAAYNDHAQKRGVTTTTEPLEFHQKCIPDALIRWKRLNGFFKKGYRVLEIGGSTGAFLEICSQTCECVCVEPDPLNRQFASKFSVGQYEYIEDVPDTEKFDIICLFHVFEHIQNPATFLKQCRRLLKVGGSIIVEVPHIEDPLLSIYDLDAYKDFYYQPMHHYIYSSKGLKHIFKSQDFYEKEVIYCQRYGLDNHLAWLKKGKPGGEPKFTKLFGNCKEYCTLLEKNGKTDTIMYIASNER